MYILSENPVSEYPRGIIARIRSCPNLGRLMIRGRNGGNRNQPEKAQGPKGICSLQAAAPYALVIR
jgi:hypothetical protein